MTATPLERCEHRLQRASSFELARFHRRRSASHPVSAVVQCSRPHHASPFISSSPFVCASPSVRVSLFIPPSRLRSVEVDVLRLAVAIQPSFSRSPLPSRRDTHGWHLRTFQMVVLDVLSFVVHARSLLLHDLLNRSI